MTYPNRSFLLAAQFCGTAILFCLLTSCTDNGLTRDKAEQLLSNANRQVFEQSCRLSPPLAGKPEFQYLQDTSFCNVQPKATGIRKVTETEVLVEWKKITTAKPEALRKWLEAFGEMEQRLTGLKGEKQRIYFVAQWVFTDPVDGQRFVQDDSAKQPENIKQSDEWRKLLSNKEGVESLLHAGKWESDTMETTFWLYDDGWRIGK